METTQDYYRNRRPEMLAFIPDSAAVVLEIGCGSGAFASQLRKRRNDRGDHIEPRRNKRRKKYCEKIRLSV